MLFRFVTGLETGQKHAILLALDVLLIPLTFVVAMLVLSAGSAPLGAIPWSFVGLLALVGGLTSHVLDLPRIRLKSYEQQAILLSTAYAGLVGIFAALAAPMLLDTPLAPGTLAMFTMLHLIATVGCRLVMRHAVIAIYRQGQPQHRVLIYGAGQTGVQLATALRTDPEVEPIAFVDDNPTLRKVMVAGLPVYSPVRIEDLIRERRIDRVVLAMPSLSRPKQARIARRLEEVGCEVSTLPSFAALIGEGPLIDRIQPVDPSDYLGRDGLDWDANRSAVYAGRSVMITGAGGSIGAELTRQLLACRPRRLVLYEISELALYQLERELSDLPDDASDTEIVPVLGSVTDDVAVRRTLLAHEVEIVMHAAAYKHVPIVERNQLAGLRNNVLGTKIVADAARDAGASHFILISTDKAVRPSNMMGASKRLAELLVQDLATRSTTTRFGIVRFGNVLGSSGSVVPLFEEQITRGGPVTLTHAQVTRYFMTISEAARLVLMAGNFTQGGEVFVLDMGTPVPIRQLARQMIEAAGYTVCDESNPDGDIEIVITGLRPGEKLHEELSAGGGPLMPTPHPKIRRTEEIGLSEIEIAAALKALSRAIDDSDEAAARAAVRRWVADYDAAPVRKIGDGISGTARPGAS